MNQTSKVNNSWLVQWGYYSGSATGIITILAYTYNVPIVLGSSCGSQGYFVNYQNAATKSSFNFGCNGGTFTWITIGY